MRDASLAHSRLRLDDMQNTLLMFYVVWRLMYVDVAFICITCDTPKGVLYGYPH